MWIEIEIMDIDTGCVMWGKTQPNIKGKFKRLINTDKIYSFNKTCLNIDKEEIWYFNNDNFITNTEYQRIKKILVKK